jgi:hypothetical protein
LTLLKKNWAPSLSSRPFSLSLCSLILHILIYNSLAGWMAGWQLTAPWLLIGLDFH